MKPRARIGLDVLVGGVGVGQRRYAGAGLVEVQPRIDGAARPADVLADVATADLHRDLLNSHDRTGEHR